MTVVVRHGRHRTGFPAADAAVAADPDAQAIIARLGVAVDPDYPRRMEHVLRVTAVVLAAKRRPNNPYARPTL